MNEAGKQKPWTAGVALQGNGIAIPDGIIAAGGGYRLPDPPVHKPGEKGGNMTEQANSQKGPSGLGLPAIGSPLT